MVKIKGGSLGHNERATEPSLRHLLLNASFCAAAEGNHLGRRTRFACVLHIETSKRIAKRLYRMRRSQERSSMLPIGQFKVKSCNVTCQI
jgi:hypothetical protein